uniref:RING-type E3 ubiquitin transferase n=1 Tax=Leersia perrieri TaxID=77586 RepID=A0A0D9VN84_9ORYZ
MAPAFTVGLAVTASKSSTYALQWALSRFTNTTDAAPIFLLIHVLTKLFAVPTPMGNYIPIDRVRNDVADAYFQDVQDKAQKMLLLYKNMCHQNKVEAQVLLVKGNDVSETISCVVAEYRINILIVGITTKSAFTRNPFGNRTSSKICKSVPSFCTAFLVSKDGLSSVYSSALEADSASSIPTSNHVSSKSDALSDAMSSSSVNFNGSSDQNPFDSPRRLGSDLPSEDPKYGVPARRIRSLTLYDYLSGSPSTYPDKDGRLTSSTGSESSKSSELRQESSLQGLMLSEHKDDISTELESLRLELRLIQGKHKRVQDESDDASRQASSMAELAAKRLEEETQLREIQSRLDKANGNVEEQRANRHAAEQALNHVHDLVRGEIMQKNMLQVKASRDADKKLRLEKLFVLNGNSYSTFTWEEINNATTSFANYLKIGSGANGTVYKGYLNHSTVAIKVLHSDDNSSNKHFRQELEVLGKIRHPHLLVLLGACVEKGCLVYEYMENGSLEDRLRCKNGTAPLAWCDRLRIAWEVASALVFLHSTKPSPIIHRDLKPENILLDGNLVSKVGDVGLSTLVPRKEESMATSSRSSSSSSTMYKKTALAGTLFYIDPEYQRTGQVSVKSDTYALGMVMLQLLTARAPIGLAEVVERAVEEGRLREVLDESGGKWPMKEAQELAQLGLSCLEMRGKDRPDLKNRVTVDLERLKHTKPEPPTHFLCPILKRVMQEPCIAADGYSYERDAIQMWLCDKDVSPVTKARLPNKTLVPNRSLLSAITTCRSQGGRKPPNKYTPPD